MRKKTLAEVNQFWNKTRKQLESRCSFPDWMEKLSALLIQMTSSSHPFSYSMIMTKGKKRRKNGLFQFRKLGQENQPGSFWRLLSLTISTKRQFLKGKGTRMIFRGRGSIPPLDNSNDQLEYSNCFFSIILRIFGHVWTNVIYLNILVNFWIIM